MILALNIFANHLLLKKDDQTLIFFLLFFTSISAGEIDGKGVICLIYGNTVGFFLRIVGHMSINRKVEKKVGTSKKEIGKYYTDENFIYFDDVKINRKTLSFQKYSSFRENAKHMKILTSLKRILT